MASQQQSVVVPAAAAAVHTHHHHQLHPNQLQHLYYPYRFPLYHDPNLNSLADRPVSLGHTHGQQHPHQQQQQVSLAAATSGVQQGQHQFPTFHHSTHPQQIPLRPHKQPRSVRTMADPSLQQHQAMGMSEEELAEMQKLSNEYQPEVTVRHFTPSRFQWANFTCLAFRRADHRLNVGAVSWSSPVH
jgi:hypothetical protein